MIDYIFKSAVWQAETIRRGELTSQELVQSSIDRIQAVNPRLNAVVQLIADRAMEEACRADEELKRGEIRGPLHGVPITIKDSLDTVGVVSTWGTVGRRNCIPRRDATVVARLKAAGVILLGKTNTPELTLSYSTDNKVYGRTNNPYDLDRTPGGSSGGAAAIVASGGSSFDIGSDTGGSIRLPAHLCGISGIRPTSGRVPRTGHAIPPGGPLDALTQIGPLARFVEDLALVLPIIAGPDGKDSWISPVLLRKMEQIRLKGLRVAYFTNNGICPPTRDIIEAVESVAEILHNSGMVIEERRPHGLEESLDIFKALFLVWVFGWARKTLDQEGTPISDSTIEGLSSAKSPRMSELSSCFSRWERFRRRMLDFMSDYDLLISPVMAYPAYLHGAYTDEDECFSYTNTFSLTGWPVVVVPVRWTKEGLPIGIQIAAQPWREDVALATAAHLEGTLGGWRQPPL